MLNNPNIQPNNAMNRWIAGILLFDFDPVHVPGTQHRGPDGLSRRRVAEEDVEERDDDWMERVLELGVWVTTWRETAELVKKVVLEDYCVGEGLLGDVTKRRVEYDRGALIGVTREGLERHLCQATVSFLCFSLFDQVDNDLDATFFPQNDQDRLVDEQIAQIKAFLISRQKPTDMDEGSLKKFLRHALRFFVKDGILWRWHAAGLHQHVVLHLQVRKILFTQAHDQLGHKGFYTTRQHLADRFWWPSINRDIKCFLHTCHECQVRSTQHVHIPPTVPVPAPLFRRVHIDTMHMPKAGGFSYIIQVRCSLISYPEFHVLRQETAVAVGKFIFNDILCCWGAVEELITDNGALIVAGLEWLVKTYHIVHIRISI